MSTSKDEAKKILEEEMGICPECHDHKPCGCENDFDLEPIKILLTGSINKLEGLLKNNCDDDLIEEDYPFECAVCGLRSNLEEKLSNNGRCFNCDSPL